MSALVGFTLVVSGVLIGGFAVWLTMYLREMRREIESLKKAQLARLPYKVADACEDVIAVLLDAQVEHEYIMTRTKQAMEIIRQIRGDHSHYDSDKPNGKKSS